MVETSSLSKSEVKSRVKELHASIAEEAEIIISEKLPQKILHMQNIISSNEEYTTIAPVRMELKTEMLPSDGAPNKKRKVDSEHIVNKNNSANLRVKPNEQVAQIMETLKTELMECIEMFGVLRTWITLSIPKIDDGNNFSVTVKEECSAELGRVEDNSFNVMDAMSKYVNMRAKLCYKMAKHPDITDYRQSVVELDEIHHVNFRVCLVEVRNNYALLHDLLTKNLSKLKESAREENITMRS